MKLRPEKLSNVIQVSLHREPPEVGLVEKLTGSLYWWVELCVPTQLALSHFGKQQTVQL